MGGRIAKTFIDQLLDRVDIVDVIERTVPLRKTGRDFQGLCPFHVEKTPSFTVSREKQFYHCFGCGAHGSAVGFLMNQGGMSFTEAVEELAAGAGLAVEYEAGVEPAVKRSDHGPLYSVMADAQQLYARLLRTHPTRERAVAYLKGRGLTGEIAKWYGIGYAPPAWDSVLDSLGTSPERQRALAEAGLTIARDQGGFYDRFRDRIMFPILDRRGRCVAFGGRVIDSGEPKYLNSPETPIFHKRQELYGLYYAHQKRRAGAPVLVVEGYMDVVALGQHGVDQVVATLGTATTAEQLEQLFRHSAEVIFCFDGDAAGRRAAWRALEATLPLLREGRKAGFLFLPQGHDPDSLVRQEGPAAFQDPSRVQGLSELLFDELARQADIRTLDGRAQLIALARPLVAKTPPGPFRQLLTQHLSELAGTEVIIRPAVPAPPVAADRRAPPTRSTRGKVSSLISRAIALLVRKPELAALADDLPARDVASDPEMALLIKLLELLREAPGLSSGALIERLRDTAEAVRLEAMLAGPALLPEELWETEFRGVMEQAWRQAERRYYGRILGVEPVKPDELAPAKKERLQRRTRPVRD